MKKNKEGPRLTLHSKSYLNGHSFFNQRLSSYQVVDLSGKVRLNRL